MAAFQAGFHYVDVGGCGGHGLYYLEGQTELFEPAETVVDVVRAKPEKFLDGEITSTVVDAAELEARGDAETARCHEVRAGGRVSKEDSMVLQYCLGYHLQADGRT